MTIFDEHCLDVYCFGELAGHLQERSGALEFAYSEGWLSGDRPPLSQSLPPGHPPEPRAVHAFFDGLLPEGRPRELVARRLHVSSGNVAGLLAELGWDCAGAVTVYPAGAEPLEDGDGDDVWWLDDDALAQLVEQLPNRPMLVDAEGEIRVSLAGVQDKLPVVVGEDGRIGLARGTPGERRRTPSTHILKSPIERLPGNVANEAFCLALARALGLPAAEAEAREANSHKFLLVRRYDRARDESGRVTRLHQEDFCQALGVDPQRKHEAEGGPRLGDLFDLVRRTATAPARDVGSLLDAVGFNFLIANHDAHAKNFSLLYGAGGGTGLAPFYDLISTFMYRSADANLSAKMAMKLGGEYRADRVGGRHLERFFTQCGLNPVAARKRLLELARQAPAVARNVRTQTEGAKRDGDVLDDLVVLISQRSERFAAMLI